MLFLLLLLLLLEELLVFSSGKGLEGARTEPKVEEGGVDCAEGDTKVLLVKDNGHVLEYSIEESLNFELLEGYAFEFDIAFQLFEVALLGELVRTSLV